MVDGAGNMDGGWKTKLNILNICSSPSHIIQILEIDIYRVYLSTV